MFCQNSFCPSNFRLFPQGELEEDSCRSTESPLPSFCKWFSLYFSAFLSPVYIYLSIRLKPRTKFSSIFLGCIYRSFFLLCAFGFNCRAPAISFVQSKDESPAQRSLLLEVSISSLSFYLQTCRGKYVHFKNIIHMSLLHCLESRFSTSKCLWYLCFCQPIVDNLHLWTSYKVFKYLIKFIVVALTILHYQFII